MRVAIAGGNLQGVEAAYLAKKAGWEVLLLDKRPDIPASGLCDQFEQVHVAEGNIPDRLLSNVDFILPAFEDESALDTLLRWGDKTDTPVAFDPVAYTVSSSKQASDLLFDRMKLAIPRPWPDCPFPVVAKPDSASGSHGVRVLKDAEALRSYIPNLDLTDEWVVQEFVPGPSYSIEVIGRPGHYTPLQVTDLFMDRQFDCKRVTAPSVLPDAAVKEFEELAITVAETLNLTGIMDLEVIYSQGRLKLLEIDARLPSQTPTAVFLSTGLNMVALLGDLFTKGVQAVDGERRPARYGLYEHIRIGSGALEIAGEHIMSQVGPVKLHPGFFGADEAITNYQSGQNAWVATMMYSGKDRQAVMKKRQAALDTICDRFQLSRVIDTEPEGLA